MFYPKDPSHLNQLLAGFFSGDSRTNKEKGSALGIVSPHAGYIYSGKVAAEAFLAIDPYFEGTFVVIGPSHRGYITSTSEIFWETPLGLVDTDIEFVQALEIEVDEVSQRDEHSLEVQVPFIRYRFPRARIAPVMMGSQDPASAAQLAEKVLTAKETTGREIRIVASSDFSHYVTGNKAKDDDLYAIGPLETLDVEEFYRRIRERDVSSCGYGPIAAMVLACRKMGATRGQLVRYATSGDATGDLREVVGYAAIAVM
jgi:AmmeMemoRadiSam system protein B